VTLTEDGTLTATEEEFVGVLRASGATLVPRLSSTELASLRLALPQMLDAVLPADRAGDELKAAVIAAQTECGAFVDPEDNFFTKDVARFGGGFDMKQLTAEPGKLAAKFDKLSRKYDQWTAFNRCTYYHWMARVAASASQQLRGRDATIVDVACGIGLPGHMLRLGGFEGHMTGTDISPGMLSQARERRVYDDLVVANANEGLAMESASVDLIVCVGAMELLDHGTVLAEFARLLRPCGKLWATFQWEGGVDESGAALPNPTEHQNVVGVTYSQVMMELKVAGFDVDSAVVEKSACAFFTPSARQDGSVQPVPYLYVSVGLAAQDNLGAGHE